MSHQAHLQKLNKVNNSLLYLDNEGTKNNTTEDKVVEDAVEDIPFAMNLAGIDLVEKLHHYKGIEDNGVMLRWWSVEWCIPAIVNVKQFLSYGAVFREIFVKINGFIHDAHKKSTGSVKNYT